MGAAVLVEEYARRTAFRQGDLAGDVGAALGGAQNAGVVVQVGRAEPGRERVDPDLGVSEGIGVDEGDRVQRGLGGVVAEQVRVRPQRRVRVGEKRDGAEAARHVTDVASR